MSDVKRGHCWYCREPGDKVPCPRCKIGVYCSQNCLGRDKRRHNSECLSFGPQKCSFCNKQLENRLECAGCGEVYYCNRECQVQHWKKHKEHCKEVKGLIQHFADHINLACYANVKRLMNLPFYFGNTLALDFLRLCDNEWELPHMTDDPALVRDYNILSVGCGDLRNLVYTIASLPKEFQGKLSITLCDFDPFVMARNVLFLYIMVAEADKVDIEKNLTTIWYSLQYTKVENKIVTSALKKLCCCSTGSYLHELTDGLIEMEDKELQVLKQVWEGWRNKWYIRCDTSKEDPAPKPWNGGQLLQPDKAGSALCRQRAKAVENVRLRDDHPGMHRYSSDRWVMSGKFTMYQHHSKDLTHDNITLTGRAGHDYAKRGLPGEYYQEYPYYSSLMYPHDEEHPYRYNQTMLEDGRDPKDVPFVYCIQGDRNPYEVWDYLEARAGGYHDFHMEDMYFQYIRDCIKLTNELIKQRRLSVKMTITEARELELEEECFDRIFISNLLDNFGMHPLVRKFGPFLNKSNKHAVLAMETLHWVEAVKAFNGEMKGVLKLGFGDEYKLDAMIFNQEYHDKMMKGAMELLPPHLPSIEDYDYDAGDVIKYLKSLYIASGNKDDETVPSTKTLMECDGLKMRDMRKGRNKVAPFRDVYRGRQGGIPGTERRMVEWFYPA